MVTMKVFVVHYLSLYSLNSNYKLVLEFLLYMYHVRMWTGKIFNKLVICTCVPGTALLNANKKSACFDC